MSSSLLNRSLEGVARQARGGRSSPYGRPDRPRADDGEKWKHDLFEGPSSGGYRKTTVPTPKLIIEGLHYEVTEAELKGLFEQIAPVQKLIVKYDRSGRPTGTAIVVYYNARDAQAARNEYDGANAKGQPITISFEEDRRGGIPTGPAAASGSGDLRSRMDLLSRMGGERQQPPPNAPRGPSGAAGVPGAPRQPRAASGGAGAGAGGRAQQGGKGAGAVRGVGGGGGRGGGANSGGGGGGGGGAQRQKRAPKSASDLDAELDAFMKAPKGSAQSQHAPAGQDGDVEMK